MIKNIFGGIAVGVANIIPGVSGGTIMVLLGLFNKIIESISNIAKLNNPQRKKDIFFLSQVLIGAAVGLVAFANVIDWLVERYPIQTIFWFIGLIVLSIPSVIKKELDGHKVSWFSLVVGLSIVLLMSYLNPGEQVFEVDLFPEITPILLIKLLLIGIIAGGTMLLPGVSGSMFLLIIGEYYLFKSYVANVLTFDSIIIVPLFFIGVGVILGILLTAKLARYCLGKHRRITVSFILGLIIASALVLIPRNVAYDGIMILTSALAFLFGAAVVVGIEKLV
jgi:putative membrane protein